MKDKNRYLSNDEISMFFLQISYILKAGVPLYDGIEGGIDTMKNGRLKAAAAEISKKLGEGVSFADCLKESGVFPPYVTAMAEIGETSGRLEEVSTSLAEYYEREKITAAKMKNAVMYPFLLFCLMSVVVLVLVFKVLPMFEKIFAQMGGDISGNAGRMMRMGINAGTAAVCAVAVIVIAIALVFVLSRGEKGRKRLWGFLLKCRLTKNLAKKMAARRFSSAMSLMLSGGVDINTALELSKAVLTDYNLDHSAEGIAHALNEGASFAEALRKSGIFPENFARMADIGMKTGSADSVMEKLSGIYDEEIDIALENAMSLIEPVLVGLISLVIGMILIAVLLPLTGVMASIG